MEVEVVKMEVCLTYPMNQYGLIDRYDAQNGFQTLVCFPCTFTQYNSAFSEGVLPPYTPSVSTNFETTSRIL